ncbi:MAG: hypothetical protein H7Z75_22980, partial [Ferruginibacter sp.]|nr:hypothetical protein [Cytophagales bacterium]
DGRSLGLLLQAFPKGNLPVPGEAAQSLPTLSVGLTMNTPGKAIPAEAPKAYLQLQAYDEGGGAAGQETRFVGSSDCLVEHYGRRKWQEVSGRHA